MFYDLRLAKAIAQLGMGNIGKTEEQNLLKWADQRKKSNTPVECAVSFFLSRVRWHIMDQNSFEDPVEWYQIACKALPVISRWVESGKVDEYNRKALSEIIDEAKRTGTKAGPLPPNL